MIGHIGKTINPSIILSFLDLTFKLSDAGSTTERTTRTGYSITANSHDTINGNAGDHVSEMAMAPQVVWEYPCGLSHERRELFNGAPL